MRFFQIGFTAWSQSQFLESVLVSVQQHTREINLRLGQFGIEYLALSFVFCSQLRTQLRVSSTSIGHAPIVRLFQLRFVLLAGTINLLAHDRSW